MKKELFEQYAVLEDQRRKLELAQVALKQQILQDMESEKTDIVEIDVGSFSLVKRKTWTYSKAVDDLEKGLKQAKKDEERRSVATFAEKLTIMYRPKNYEL